MPSQGTVPSDNRHCYLYAMAQPRSRLPRPLRRALAALSAAALWVAAPAIAQQPAHPAPEPPEAALLVTDVVKGIGDEALPGMIVIVHYTGWLYDPQASDHRGRKFDSSRE